ncbi:MAG TPA: hypothetical protein PLI65_09600 [Bacteroidales bacterium]|nr:hypothetical protein [Bacteroidales bacterium]
MTTNELKMKQKFPLKTLLWVTLFGIAFANIESAVVIYLRDLFYPDGFSFPLKIMSNNVESIRNISLVEVFREFATMLLLVSIAAVTSKNFNIGFAWFIYAFAIWDIFYYFFLFVFLGWPESLLTWDVLFLLPFTWVGPVIAPITNSICMILLALVIIRYWQTEKLIKKWHWTGLIVGSIIIIISYTEDYVGFMLTDFSLFELMNINNTGLLMDKMQNYVPQRFAWWLYFIGVITHLFIIGNIFFTARKKEINL